MLISLRVCCSLVGIIRYYDTLIYPDQKDLETVSHNEGQSTLSKVMEYFKSNFPDVHIKTQEILPVDQVLRYFSLRAHLLQYQTIIVNKSFEIHSSTVNQISRNIVSIYSQTRERHFQVEYYFGKPDYPKSPLEETKQVGFN